MEIGFEVSVKVGLGAGSGEATMVEDLLTERSIDVRYETVRLWWNRLGRSAHSWRQVAIGLTTPFWAIASGALERPPRWGLPAMPPGHRRSLQMSFLAWLVVGLIAGFLASKVVNKTGSGLILDIVLGVVGAFVGGFIFNFFGHSAPTGINVYSVFVAFIGAVVVLLVYHAVVRRRAI
jgi:uncharacterized membrane protein YeaQ/YmgE (transglycosylase-associated protein family)